MKYLSRTMENIRRVFFHELGHLVANEINLRFYNGSGTEKICLYPCFKGSLSYCGYTKPFLPKGKSQDTPPSKDKLAESILSTMYGCFFQSYDQNSTLIDCLKMNGDNDVDVRYSFLSEHGIGFKKSELAELDLEYYDELCKTKALDEFMLIDPNDFLEVIGENKFNVKITKLKEAIEKIIINHSYLYKQQIEKYQSVINK